MSFWDRFESKQDGIEDTIEFTIRMAVVTLACVILVVVVAMVVGMFVPNDVVDSDKVFEIIGPAFNTIVGAFVGLLGGLSLNANARDAKPEEPTEPTPVDDSPVAPTPVAANETFFTDSKPEDPELELSEAVDDDDDDDMAPWEKYRGDLRYDLDGDGQITEADFPDWRNPNK